MNTSSIVIIILLVIILIPAVRLSITHMKGEGDCCGGPKQKAPRKRIKGQKMGELIVHIDNMKCVNCKNRVETVLDELDGVVAKVNLDKKIAVVSLYKDVDEAVIRQTVEGQGYKVSGIDKV